MKVAIFGVGGVGGYLGARLVDAGTAEVAVIARGRHLEALRRHGLRLDSVFGDAHVAVTATDDPATIGPVDMVVFTVKSTDTATAADRLGPLLADETGVVTFQNGVGNVEVIAERTGRDHVLGGVAFIFSTISEPGVIQHTGGPTRFLLGELNGSRSDRAQRFARACADAGVDVEVTDDIRAAMWRKYAFICALSGMTTASRLPVGDLRADDAAWEMFTRMVHEVLAVAEAQDVHLPASTADELLELAADLEPGARSSLYHDFTHDKPLELEALSGAVVRMGQRLGVPVPMNEAVYALLSPWATRRPSPRTGDGSR